ncbi:hypothetical protein KFK09_024250 [Dendrobium nobile]|uniref:Uncharacterized protein n=1 Tax=Dendrobium nobile TaxID=94219 RepID=A0A8T3ADA4_DENNO|nr:hypothetical protein KFK09_024250 [Dendrobium nobile]
MAPWFKIAQYEACLEARLCAIPPKLCSAPMSNNRTNADLGRAEACAKGEKDCGLPASFCRFSNRSGSEKSEAAKKRWIRSDNHSGDGEEEVFQRVSLQLTGRVEAVDGGVEGGEETTNGASITVLWIR